MRLSDENLYFEQGAIMMEKTFTIDNPMPPLWLMYPHIHPLSIGWRMGSGEGYKFDFFDWLKTLSESERKQYQEMFPPPRIWGWNRYYWDENAEKDEYEGYYRAGAGDYGLELWSENGEPQYSKEWLVTKVKNAEFLFFWQPGDIEYEPECCFGQWQYSEFSGAISMVEDYTCAEQYMMAEKARLFEDEEAEKLIMEAADPKQMKALGRKVKNFREDIWLKLRYSVVLNGNYLKFAQNKSMRDTLLATGDKILVEASPLDVIWGIGHSKNKAEATNPQLWRGLNLLGFALMEVRDELRRVYRNYGAIGWPQLADYK